MSCTEWLWSRFPDGYGRIKHKGRDVPVHRLAYCQANGIDMESIKGLVVRHKCDNKGCCNPDHLEIGSQRDNMRDKIERGRANSPRGESNGSSVLTDAQVEEMRSKYTGQRGQKSALSREYGISISQGHLILSGKSRL